MKSMCVLVIIIIMLCISVSSYVLLEQHNRDIKIAKEHQAGYPYEGYLSNTLWDQCIESVPCGFNLSNLSCMQVSQPYNQTCNHVFDWMINFENHHVMVYNSDGIYHWESDR